MNSPFTEQFLNAAKTLDAVQLQALVKRMPVIMNAGYLVRDSMRMALESGWRKQDKVQRVLEVLVRAPGYTPNLDHGNELLFLTTCNWMFTLIPVLHNAGERLGTQSNMVLRNVLDFTGRGYWPYPDLLFPELLADEGHVKKVADAFFWTSDLYQTDEPVIALTPEHINRVANLKHSDKLGPALTDTLIHSMRSMGFEGALNNLRGDGNTVPVRQAALVRLFELGWLEVETLREKTQGMASGKALTAILDDANLHLATPQATKKSAGPMRL